MVLNCDHNKKLDKDFFYYLMLAQDFSACITGTGQPQIVRGPLAEFVLRLPSDIPEQRAIAAVLTDIDAELAVLEQRLSKTRNIKQAMMQELSAKLSSATNSPTRFYAEMSRLLDDLIKQSRADTAAYEAFLKKAEDLVKRMAQKDTGGHPAELNGCPGAIVLFDNLATLPGTTFRCPANEDGKARLALELDLAIRENAPAGWKGDHTRETQVLNALFPIMSRDRQATQAVFI